MEILLILAVIVLAVYYAIKQSREQGILVFPHNQVKDYSNPTEYAVKDKSSVAAKKEDN